jgi:replicative DNA helicase
MKSKAEGSSPNLVSVEKIVLGSILIDSTAIDRVISDFSINLFSDKANRNIAHSIIKLYRENKPIDIVTLCAQLTAEQNISESGGAIYLASLTNSVGTTSNLLYHIRILQEEALRRNLIRIGTKATSKSLEPDQDIFELFNETQNDLDSAIRKVINYETQAVGSIHDEIISKSIEMLKSGSRSGLETGLRLLDNLTNGWQNSDLIILAGRPGMGKTAFAVSMCIHPSIEKKEPIAIFSLEMSNEQLVSRMQSFLSGVNVSKIVKKQLSIDEINQISTSASSLKDAPIFIDDTPNISLIDLKGKARKLKKEHGIKLLVIDYLQLMRSGMKSNSREQEIAEISRGLKSLAKELNIPVVALSQLSRSVEQRSGDKKPMLQDLRESGQIEQDADMVAFCYRPEYYGIENYEVGNMHFDTHGLFILLIAKHRNGELGEIPLTFIHEQTKVCNRDLGYSNFSNVPKAINSFENNENKPKTIYIQPTENSNTFLSANTSFDDQDIFTPDENDETPF